MFLSPISIILSTLCITYAKIYERCELARELRNFDLPEDEIPTWVCIAQHESDYNTSAMNHGSGDHGLFQISQIYWCSPPGYGCNSPCSKFRDDDIADDLQCIRRIYNEHTRISGNGFTAWVVYSLYCKNDNSMYIKGCFDQGPAIPTEIFGNATENEIPDEEVDEYGDGYHFPPLPGFSKTIQEDSLTTFSLDDGYNFPRLPYSRTSIHDSVPVRGHTYDFSTFPFSKLSIHNFIPAPKPSEKTISSTTEEDKQNVYKFPILPVYSEQPIQHLVPASTTNKKLLINVVDKTNKDEFEYKFPSLSKIYKKKFQPSKAIQSNKINYAHADTTEDSDLVSTFKSTTSKPFTTTNLFSLSTMSYKPPIKPVTDTVKSTINTLPITSSRLSISTTTSLKPPTRATSTTANYFSQLNRQSPADAHITKTNKALTRTLNPINSKSVGSSTKQLSSTSTTKLFSTNILQPFSTEIRSNNTTLNPFFSSSKPSTSTTILPTYTLKQLNTNLKSSPSDSSSKPFAKRLTTFASTSKPVVSFLQLATTTSPPFTQRSIIRNHFSSDRYDLQGASTLKPFRVVDKSFTTTLKPALIFTSTSKPVASSLKPVTTTSTSFTQRSTTKKLFSSDNYDLQGASSTLKSYGAVFNSFTSTLKPFLTFKGFTKTTAKPYSAQRTFTEPFTQRDSVTTTDKPFTYKTPFTKKTLIPHAVATLKSFSNFTVKSSTTAIPKNIYKATSKPLGKQVTFAPDSFFSWIFGSQTLPPLVPPGRPPRPSRPGGERPGSLPRPSTIRPSNERPRPERPGGLPRPHPPERPGGIHPARRPDDLSQPELASGQRPEFGMRHTRRPFGHRPSDLSRPFSLQEQPFTRKKMPERRSESTAISLASFTTPLPAPLSPKQVTTGPGSVLGIFKQVPSKAYSNDSVTAQITTKLPNISGRFGLERTIDKDAVEVKLDDNFLFLRTRFGYRLFRLDKN